MFKKIHSALIYLKEGEILIAVENKDRYVILHVKAAE
jgi:hypothetical protein